MLLTTASIYPNFLLTLNNPDVLMHLASFHRVKFFCGLANGRVSGTLVFQNSHLLVIGHDLSSC